MRSTSVNQFYKEWKAEPRSIRTKRVDEEKAGLLPQGLFDFIVGGGGKKDLPKYEPLSKEVINYFGGQEGKALKAASEQLALAVKTANDGRSNWQYYMDGAVKAVDAVAGMIDGLLQSIDLSNNHISGELENWWNNAQGVVTAVSKSMSVEKTVDEVMSALDEIGDYDTAVVLDESDGVLEKCSDADMYRVEKALYRLDRHGFSDEADTLAYWLDGQLDGEVSSVAKSKSEKVDDVDARFIDGLSAVHTFARSTSELLPDAKSSILKNLSFMNDLDGMEQVEETSEDLLNALSDVELSESPKDAVAKLAQVQDLSRALKSLSNKAKDSFNESYMERVVARADDLTDSLTPKETAKARRDRTMRRRGRSRYAREMPRHKLYPDLRSDLLELGWGDEVHMMENEDFDVHHIQVFIGELDEDGHGDVADRLGDWWDEYYKELYRV